MGFGTAPGGLRVSVQIFERGERGRGAGTGSGARGKGRDGGGGAACSSWLVLYLHASNTRWIGGAGCSKRNFGMEDGDEARGVGT